MISCNGLYVDTALFEIVQYMYVGIISLTNEWKLETTE